MSAVLARRLASLSTVGLLTVAALTGCGSSSSSTTGSPGPRSFGSGGPQRFSLDPALRKKVQKCLEAAGLSASLPTGRPSAFASGSPPSGAPSGRFTVGPGGGFPDSQVQSALKACGITLPSRPTGSPSGAPSGG